VCELPQARLYTGWRHRPTRRRWTRAARHLSCIVSRGHANGRLPRWRWSRDGGARRPHTSASPTVRSRWCGHPAGDTRPRGARRDAFVPPQKVAATAEGEGRRVDVTRRRIFPSPQYRRAAGGGRVGKNPLFVGRWAPRRGVGGCAGGLAYAEASGASGSRRPASGYRGNPVSAVPQCRQRRPCLPPLRRHPAGLAVGSDHGGGGGAPTQTDSSSPGRSFWTRRDQRRRQSSV